MLVAYDELEGVALGNTADGGRGMQGLQQVADAVVGGQFEGEVAAQLNQVGSTDGARPFLAEVVGKALQALGASRCRFPPTVSRALPSATCRSVACGRGR